MAAPFVREWRGLELQGLCQIFRTGRVLQTNAKTRLFRTGFQSRAHLSRRYLLHALNHRFLKHRFRAKWKFCGPMAKVSQNCNDTCTAYSLRTVISGVVNFAYKSTACCRRTAVSSRNRFCSS